MTRERDPGRRSPLQRRVLGIALATGSVLIVLAVLGSLLTFVLGSAAGVEEGAVWTILLMILVTFGTVGWIGWGLFSALRDGGSEEDDGGDGHRPPGGREGGDRR